MTSHTLHIHYKTHTQMHYMLHMSVWYVYTTYTHYTPWQWGALSDEITKNTLAIIVGPSQVVFLRDVVFLYIPYCSAGWKTILEPLLLVSSVCCIQWVHVIWCSPDPAKIGCMIASFKFDQYTITYIQCQFIIQYWQFYHVRISSLQVWMPQDISNSLE